MQDLIRVRKRFEGQAISGKVAFPAPLGLFVQYDPTDLGTPSLMLATGTKAFSLQRQILDDQGQGIPLQNLVFPNSIIINPELINNFATAAKLIEAEVEGPTFLPQSGVADDTGRAPITAETASETALTTFQGGLIVAGDNDEIFATVVGQLPPVDSTNPARVMVQFVQ